MTQPAFAPLSEATSQLEQKISKPFKKLLLLHKKGLSVAPSVLVKPETLQNIFHNNLSTKKELLKTYHQQFKNDFVCLYYVHNNKNLVQIENIKGDANLIQTIQEIATHIHDTSLLIQADPQPSFSGIAFTRNNQNNDKRQLVIEFMQAAFNEADTANHQRIVVDVRTSNIIEKSLPQKTAWKRSLDGLTQKSFDSKQQIPSPAIISRLTKQLTIIKREFFTDQKIHWSVVNQNLLIHMVEEMGEHDSFEHQGKLLSLGTCLIPGFVQGRPFFPASDNHGSILVITSLSSKQLGLVKRSNGIVVEQTITDHAILQFLEKFKIPTIVHAQFATKNILPNQELLLDASSGKIFASQESRSLANSTSSKVGVIGGDSRLVPDQTLTNIDSYLLSSNNFFASLNLHPLALQNKQKTQLISELVSAAKACDTSFSQWKYMLFSMSNNLRLKLNRSAFFETQIDTNPSFGSRGISFLLENQSILNLELDALGFISQHLTSPVNLVVPFIKTKEDLLLTHKIVETKTSFKHNLWLHLTTFASCDSLLNTTLLNTTNTQGLILDIDYLAASWLGTDPQLTFSENELLSSDSFWQLLAQKTTSSQKQIEVLVRNTSSRLAHKLQEEGYSKIITTPQHLTAARMAQT